MDVPLHCMCGKIRGVARGVDRSTGTRCSCYCRDCQAFARFLGGAAILDRWGGTDIYQMSPGRLEIDAADGALACVRLSDKGMHRWYCASCKTPIANTLTAKMPFAGVIHSFMDHVSTGMSRDDLLGVTQPIQTKSAHGDGAPKQKARYFVTVMMRTMVKVLGWQITGAGKKSPFFDAKTGEPKVPPRVLTSEERGALVIMK